ncbi:MAG: hypothetical protein KF901_16065 [Myxococcales bacterium]|nr:hypothetical protein [Myxococcales bacterium]
MTRLDSLAPQLALAEAEASAGLLECGTVRAGDCEYLWRRFAPLVPTNPDELSLGDRLRRQAGACCGLLLWRRALGSARFWASRA